MISAGLFITLLISFSRVFPKFPSRFPFKRLLRSPENIFNLTEMSEKCCGFSHFVDLLPAEVKHIVVNYLNVPDLLSLCGTCKSLNEFIGQSHDCMKKIWIKFYSFKLKDLESLTLTVRNYEKLKINRVKFNDHFRFLADLQQSWRKVLIYNCEFKRIEQLLDLIESFSESIEELEISDIEILNNDQPVCALKFPKLRRLMLRNVPSTAVEAFLGMNKNLENAAFDILQEVEGKIPLEKLIFQFLENNQKLQHLQLGPHYIKSLFDQENIKLNFDFKLSKLLLKFPLIRDSSPNIAQNISRFLSHQPNIDWILFLELESDEVLTIAWNGIPSIKHITFVGLECLFDDTMELTLEVNEKIEQVELLSRKILISQLRKILVAAPCLKILHVHTLTKYILEFIARNHHQLHKLRYENIDEEVAEIYDQLKASHEDVNRSIVLKKTTFWFEPSNPFTLDPTFWHT